MRNKNSKISIAIFSVLILALSLPPSPAFASGASLYFSPNSGTFFIGSTFNISIFLNTDGNDINAVRVDLRFDPKKIQIVSPTAGRSFISVWIAQPTYSNIAGTVSFQGGVPSPGINTSAGLVSTITFRAVSPGETTIYLSDSSQVLLNDGKGTNVLSSKGRGIYSLTVPPPEGPQVFSLTHPDQNKWYKDNNPSFTWEKEAGVSDFSFDMDKDFSSIPDNISEGDQSSVSYSDLEDGIWYFHIKAKVGNLWGGTSHYVVQIDATPPAAFDFTFEPRLKLSATTNQEPVISFVTTDALSGIGHYELKTINLNESKTPEDSFFFEASSPYRMPKLASGENEIVVRAFDIAGNWRDSSKRIEVIPAEKLFFITKSGVNVWFIFLYWWQIVLFLLLLLVLFLILLALMLKKNKEIEEKKKNIDAIKEKAEKNKQDFHGKIYPS